MFDVIIVGRGPAGLAAAIYAARYKLKTIVIGKQLGGAIIDSHLIENWPGFKKISGIELMQAISEQVKDLGCEINDEDAVEIVRDGSGFIVKTKSGEFKGKTIILATGTGKGKINAIGEEQYSGKGISYCYTCDAALFKNKVVAVAGGGNAACHATLLLTEYAKVVYHIHRGDLFKCEPMNIEKIQSNPKVQVINKTNIVEISGDRFVRKIKLDNGQELAVDGVFVEIGKVPNTYLAGKLGVELNEKEYIKVDAGQSTNIEGVYAAGDVTTGSNGFRQLVTAMSEGAIAANSIFKYLINKK